VVLSQLVRFVALDIDDKADAAGVALDYADTG
jgi:hypothetical protein